MKGGREEMKSLLVILCCVVAFQGTVKAEEITTEAPARTPFRMELKQVHRIEIRGIRPNSWAILRIAGKDRLCFIDLKCEVFEHQMESLTGACPKDVWVENGELWVRSEGRTYKYAPQGRLARTVGIAPITRQWCGPLGVTYVTLPEFVQGNVVIEDTQWVEVTTHVVNPTPVPRSETLPQPADAKTSAGEEIPLPPTLIVPPSTEPTLEPAPASKAPKATKESLNEEKTREPKGRRPKIA